MEAVEVLNDAAPQLIEKEMADDASMIVPDDVHVPFTMPEGSCEESSPVATETAREGVDAVIEHTLSDESAIEDSGVDDSVQEEVYDGSPCDTLPMYDESGEDTPVDAVESPKNGEEEMEVPSPLADDESSLLQPDTNETTQGNSNNVNETTTGKVPSTFPHCHICGFDRETVFLKEKKAQSGQFKNKVIYRNRCVRKKCNRFFGPSYTWNGKAGVYVKVFEQSGACARPYENGPRDEKFPAEDYERAAQSGVRPPHDNNSALMMATKAAKAAANARKTKEVKKARKSNDDEDESLSSKRRIMQFFQLNEEQKDAAIAKATATMETTETQTGDDDHIIQVIVEEMRTKAAFRGLQPPTDDIPMSVGMSHRLFLTKKIMIKQTQEIKTLRSERDLLKKAFTSVVEMMTEYRSKLITDTTRLKEDVQVANRELKNFSLEMQNEANKDIREINKFKEAVAKRVDDTDRYRRKVEASMEYQQSITEEAEDLADEYHKLSVTLEKDIILAKAKAKDANDKLEDKLYIANNTKCTHCQVNERIKSMLTEQIADKTLSNTNLSKEREMMAKELKNMKLVHSIVDKENQQLKFEVKAWESNSHRLKAELDQLKGCKTGVPLVGEAAFTPPTPRPTTQSTTTTSKETEGVSPERNGEVGVDRPPGTSSSSPPEDGEYKSPGSISPHSLAQLPPPPLPPAPSILTEKEASPEHAAEFSSWIPKERKVQEVPVEMKEAMRKVEESLAKGPMSRKEEKGGGPPHKKDKRDEKGGGAHKRTGGSSHSLNPHHKNGEKKPKLDVTARKEEKAAHPRSIPTVGSGSKGILPTPMMKEKDKEEKERRREERNNDPSPVPFASTHEPAFPAVVAKKAVMVPYNGPSSLVAASTPPPSLSSTHTQQQMKHAKGSPEKKTLSFLPVAGSTVLPSLPLNNRETTPRAVPVDALLREAERLRQIEREREMRRARERDREIEMEREQQTAALHRVYDHVAASIIAADRRAGMTPLLNGGGGRFADMDADLPWNQGRAQTYQQPRRPTTPIQDWYDNSAAQAPPSQPRAPSPRYLDDMYDSRAPRDQYGRLEPDFGAMRYHHSAPPPHHHPYSHAPPLRGAPPPSQAPPLQESAWRREWHEPNWSDEPPRRGYWD